MGMIYKCDRCGKKFSSHDMSKMYTAPNTIYAVWIEDNRPDLNDIAGKDLCPKCTEKFFNWMQKKNKEN